MPVIIKDFQVVTEPSQPPTSTPAATPPRREPRPPAPKQVAQTLRYLKERLARVHAD
jgi:hypothetical protein